MWRQGVSYIPGEIARVVPVFILLGALIATFAALRTVRRIRDIRRSPLASDAGA
jgi:cell division protein FtsX